MTRPSTVLRSSTLIAAVAVLSACASVESLETRPMQVAGETATAAARTAALAALFPEGQGPHLFALCEAEPERLTCDDPDDGLGAAGLGGIFLPLVMDVDGLTVLESRPSDRDITIRADVSSTVNGIPPACATADGVVRAGEDGSATLSLSGFYCNWAVIGNVITQVSMSIDQVDPDRKSFAGAYALGFNGTGNAAGSGHYRATFVHGESAAFK